MELSPALVRSPVEFAAQQDRWDGDIYPFFEEYCFRCHGDRKQESGVDLESFTTIDRMGHEERTWERVLMMLESGQMPPSDRPQPTPEDRTEIAAFIEDELDTAIRAMRPDPGRVTARRLNRQEYDNTVRDLLGVEGRPSRAFPVDDSGYGFDNIGDVLSTSPLLMEKYLRAAEEIAGEAIERERVARWDVEDGAGEGDVSSDEGEEEAEPLVFVCGHYSGEHVARCGRVIVRDIASRAYRRPVTRAEVNGLVSLVDLVEADGGSFEEGVQLAIAGILVSPHFLYRIEGDRRPDDPASMRFVNDFELASRLSYFLWTSMPDAELLDIARDGTLREPEVLTAQLTRMIGDEKAWAFVENFAGQWLQLRNLRYAGKDREQFPTYSSALRASMREESELFFDAVLRDDLSILNFLNSDFTFVDEALAAHYGIEGVSGEEHRRVALDPGGQRGGVLTQASVLSLTSYPRRTSPVLRGAWVLENVLGAPTPPPPDDIPKLEENPAAFEGTFRQQLEAHRADASCASCHSRIDPLGFGLENYNAVGQWRTMEREYPVDSSGVMPTGETFEGSAELRRLLLDDPDDFIRCFTEKVLTYALGRGVESYDRPVVAAIVDAAAAEDYRFQTLIREIVMSAPFQIRRGEGDRTT